MAWMLKDKQVNFGNVSRLAHKCHLPTHFVKHSGHHHPRVHPGQLHLRSLGSMEKERKKEHNNKEIRGMTAVNMFLQLHVVIAAGLTKMYVAVSKKSMMRLQLECGSVVGWVLTLLCTCMLFPFPSILSLECSSPSAGPCLTVLIGIGINLGLRNGHGYMMLVYWICVII